MKLSILIPTLESRKEQRHLLMDSLLYEHEGADLFVFKLGMSKPNLAIAKKDSIVEIIVFQDSGQKSVGTKRQELLEAATGDYIAFIDDDDEIAPDYIAKILKAIESNPDCCSLTGVLRWVNNGTEELFEHSLEHDAWEKKDGVYLRYPNHLNAVKRELALQVGFKDMGHGEDRDYSDRLKPLLKTEAKIDGVLYYYNCRG